MFIYGSSASTTEVCHTAAVVKKVIVLTKYFDLQNNKAVEHCLKTRDSLPEGGPTRWGRSQVILTVSASVVLSNRSVFMQPVAERRF